MDCGPDPPTSREEALVYLIETPDGFSLRDLWQPIEESLQRKDLEAHLVALILRSQRTVGASSDRTLAALRDGFDRRNISDVTNGQHIATIGFRLALGYPVDVPASFPNLLKKELAREPLLPAACVRDDERLLLGVAAGIGSAAPLLAEPFGALIRERERDLGFRQAAIDIWAESVTLGSALLTNDTARRACSRLGRLVDDAAPSEPDDFVVAFWLAGVLLEAAWTPSDEQLAIVERVLQISRPRVLTIIARGEIRSAVDAAFAFEAFATNPAASFARRSAVEGVLDVINAFPASADVLKNRHRGRPDFLITDEYDVQDLFHALILPVIPDVVTEDPAPKIAGRSSRLDFVSKKARLGFELKHLKSAGDRDRVREEVLLDERVYQAHPCIDTVVVFISDPSSFLPLAERNSFEADLSQPVIIGGRTIKYIVRVR